MRTAHPIRLILAAMAAAATSVVAPVAHAQDVLAAAPVDLSVTVYRDPNRQTGGFDLNNLQGFALITETRHVVLPPGEHRVRFEGVADGIEPASAIVTGLPDGVIEKNRDAALISPSALIDAAQAQGGRVLLSRINPGTGARVRTEGNIRSGADGGVVFETPDGVEALRCSGLSETFSFASTGTGLSARPTLSVLTRTTKRVDVVVQLSYLARGFDWSADYVANMQGKPGKLDLGAWITLANGNGVGFPGANVQIVAGRLNRESGEVEPISIGQPILARCWPQGSTSDTPEPITIERAFPYGFNPNRYDYYADRVVVTGSMMKSTPEDAPSPVAVYSEATQEELGDLKLYRIPGRTTLASRQSKQVRMLDRSAVSVAKIYEAELYANQQEDYQFVPVLLRTTNDQKNNLGLPLPSGRVSLFELASASPSAGRLLSGETRLRDIALNEETEFRFAGGADVQVRQDHESRTITNPPPPFLPGYNDQNVSPISTSEVSMIELTNAHPYAIQVEVRLTLEEDQSLVRADRPSARKDGRPIFRVTVPANDSLLIRYQTAVQ